MALSKAKRKALTAAGMDKAALAKLEAILDADEGDADNGDKPSGSKRVVVYEGEDAESFMRSMFKGSDDDEGSEDSDEPEAEDEDEADDTPAKGPRWFK